MGIRYIHRPGASLLFMYTYKIQNEWEDVVVEWVAVGTIGLLIDVR